MYYAFFTQQCMVPLHQVNTVPRLEANLPWPVFSRGDPQASPYHRKFLRFSSLAWLCAGFHDFHHPLVSNWTVCSQEITYIAVYWAAILHFIGGHMITWLTGQLGEYISGRSRSCAPRVDSVGGSSVLCGYCWCRKKASMIGSVSNL